MARIKGSTRVLHRNPTGIAQLKEQQDEMMLGIWLLPLPALAYAES